MFSLLIIVIYLYWNQKKHKLKHHFKHLDTQLKDKTIYFFSTILDTILENLTSNGTSENVKLD